MELMKDLFLKIIVPMVWLVFFAYAFAFSAIRLAKAWKDKSFKLIWLYVWILLVGVYFLFLGGV